MKKLVLLIFIISLNTFLLAKDKRLVESQPEIIFNYDKLIEDQEKFRLQVDFNKAILLLEKQEYKKAIDILKRTSKLLKIPSFLNIGIAYYKLDSLDNALLYLNNIYNFKELAFSDTYSYISACYYLYKIKKEEHYLTTIVDLTKKYKTLSEHSKRMLADTFIILKKYEKALKVLDVMEFEQPLKKAMLYLKLKDYEKATLFLKIAKESTFNQDKIDKIMWLMVFKDLKSNDIENLKDDLDELNKRKEFFKTNLEYPLEIFFNKNKYAPREYMSLISEFGIDRQIDFIFYFAPFIFSDKEEILYDMSKGFIFKDRQNVESLEEMIAYNSEFIDIIKEDPIIRIDKMKKFIKEDTNSYVYYNLALCYAQINDFHSAFKFFTKAYKLNPGNKLYAMMSILSAKKVGKKVKDFQYLEQNIKSKDGMYKYFGQKLYSLIVNKKFEVIFEPRGYEKTIFYKALDYIKKKDEDKITLKHPLLVDHYKDPLVYLMKLIYRKKGQNDFSYFSNIQDNIPLSLNNNFLESSQIVTQYYVDILKAIGLFYKADLVLEASNTPSYKRTKALIDLHMNKPKKTLEALASLQKKYKLEDKFTMYLIVAALLEEGKYNDASIQISLIKAILNDSGADFLTGVQLIQDLKLNSAFQYFQKPYMDTLIDFRLVNFDNLLESL